MIQVTGGLLLFGAFSWVGLYAGWELRRKTSLLEELLGAVETLGREMEQSLKPLPDLLEEIGNRTEGVLSVFFAACAQHARRPDPSFVFGWNRELELLAQNLDEQVQRCMARLGKGLGRYDEAGERQLLAATAAELRACLARSREACRQRCRLYGVLGMTAGAMCVILCW